MIMQDSAPDSGILRRCQFRIMFDTMCHFAVGSYCAGNGKIKEEFTDVGGMMEVILSFILICFAVLGILMVVEEI